jgi:hypothetical protein
LHFLSLDNLSIKSIVSIKKKHLIVNSLAPFLAKAFPA